MYRRLRKPLCSGHSGARFLGCSLWFFSLHSTPGLLCFEAVAGREGPCSPVSGATSVSAGLEPEIQKLIAKHKQEVRRLRGLHEAELQQRDEQAAQRQLRQAEELREHLEREKEALGKQERERAQQR